MSMIVHPKWNYTKILPSYINQLQSNCWHHQTIGYERTNIPKKLYAASVFAGSYLRYC